MSGRRRRGHPGLGVISGDCVHGGFNRSSQHLEMEVVRWVFGSGGRRVRAMRGQMWSPGRPSTARREDRVRFWKAIARGVSTEDAAVEAGVSQAVGSRWFRQAGGMPPLSLAPLSGRYLSFAEREEIAILHAQQHGVREIARQLGRSPSTISRELRRNASTRSDRVELSGDDRPVARRAARQPAQGRQARRQRRAARVRAGSARRGRSRGPTGAGAGPDGALHRPSPRTPGRPAVGEVVEPGADLEPAAGRLPR